MLFEVLVFGLFGAIFGSFLNVVILRRGTKSIGGRSGCFSCGAPLAVRDLIPIVSWVFLRGRCRSCGSAVSVQYPLVEASTAILFALIGGIPNISFSAQLLSCAIAAYFVLIAAYDLRHTIIPDAWVYTLGTLTLVWLIVAPPATGILQALLAGPVAALPFAVLWAISRGRWMGLGDAKLALAIGWLLGPLYGLYAVFLAFVIGAVVGVFVLMPLPYYRRILRKAGIVRRSGHGSYTMKSEVPFGPFLAFSCILVWLLLWYGFTIPLPL